MRKLSNKLKDGPIICAGGYLFELERRGNLKAGAFVPEVVLEHPEALRELHREFLRAGSDVIIAFTYYAHREKMKAVGREGDLERLNRKALRIAKRVARQGGALCCGDICNTWAYDAKDKISHKKVRAIFTEQVAWAKEEGADFILAETIFYLGEALIALEVIKEAGMECVINLAPFHEKTLDGYRWEDACKILYQKGADIVGLNCARGPRTMLPILRKVRKKVQGPVSAMPVAYNTTHARPNFQKLTTREGKQAFPVNLEHYLLTRDEAADFALKAKEIGINLIGLCCGGAPHHIRSMAESLRRTPKASKYSPDMSQHAVLGDKRFSSQANRKKSLKDWR